MQKADLEKALALLGPLEARIMREVWLGGVNSPFSVWDMQRRMPELAYTTVMTTVARLAQKGLLHAEKLRSTRFIPYRPSGTPSEFLRTASASEVDRLVNLFGEAAFAAFEARLGQLSADQRERLRKLADR